MRLHVLHVVVDLDVKGWLVYLDCIFILLVLESGHLHDELLQILLLSWLLLLRMRVGS